MRFRVQMLADLRKALVDLSPAPEKHSEFGELVRAVEDELKAASLIGQPATTLHVIYRPTALDVRSILQSLVPHVQGCRPVCSTILQSGVPVC